MARKYSFPTDHWDWPVKLTHHHAVRAGNMIFTGGQVDLDANGIVRNLGNLNAQCHSSMTYMASLLDDLSVGFSDLVRLVVYYVGDAKDEAMLLDQLAQIIGAKVRPVVSMINLPELCYPGMLIEIEGVAMRTADGSIIPKTCLNLEDMPLLPQTFSHVVRSGNMIFTSDMSSLSPEGAVAHPNDIAEQTTIMMERLDRVLLAVGAASADVVKVNTFYRGDGTALDWERSAKIRGGYFANPGPAATGIPLPSFPHQGLATKISATAICGKDPDGKPLQKHCVWPDGHWNWSASMPYKHGNVCDSVVHIGGQVSLDSSTAVIHPNDMVAQTRIAMKNLELVLAELGATLDDVVKITTFYQGNASAEALHENLLIRSNSYNAPGPSTTGIPVPALVYENMVIEIEAIAILN